MSIYIYTDEDVNPLLAEILKERGYSATTAKECERLSYSDQEQLTFATLHHYTLLTHNIRDFCELARSLNQQKLTHSGIILAPQWEFPKLLNATLRLINDWQNRDPSNHVIWLHSYFHYEAC